MKVRIMELQDVLNLPRDTDLTNLEDDEE